jgi:Flp pilus assembly protein TadG
MKTRTCYAPVKRRQRGVAAIELALISVAIFGLLPFVFWFGRVFYEYNVLLKAGHQATRYMASLSALEIGSVAASTTATATARQMVIDAGSGAGIDLTALSIGVECNPDNCGTAGELPATVRVRFATTLADDVFSYFTEPLLGDAVTIRFDVDITQPYAD